MTNMPRGVTRRATIVNHYNNAKDDECVDPVNASPPHHLLISEGCEGKMRLRFHMSERNRKRIVKYAIKGVIVGLAAAYILVPLAIVVFPGILKALIFLSMAGRPWFFDYTRPEGAGLKGTRNFYIEAEEGIQLGTWHILPKSLLEGPEIDTEFYELSLRKGNPVVLYMHGNSGSRAGSHRVELYKMLQNLNAHVFAFDYRGYADSTRVSPSENGAVLDGKAIFSWLKQRVGSSPIFVWGHSLGTGVATKAVHQLCQEGDPPKGLVLEAPFNNMFDEVLLHPFSKFFKIAPWYRWAAYYALKSKEMLFESDKHIMSITIPILILHAEDDGIVPVELGQKLHQAAVEGRRKTPTSLLLFEEKHKYGHRYICRAPSLPEYIRNFLHNPEKPLTNGWDNMHSKKGVLHA